MNKKNIAITLATFIVTIIINSSLCIFPFSPYPTQFIYFGQVNQVGGILDVNGDGLPDVAVGYYQRDYNFAITEIWLNDGCTFVKHIAPFEQLAYCNQFFEQQRMLAWELNPPVVELTIAGMNISRIMTLPYNRNEFLRKIENELGIAGEAAFEQNELEIDYLSLQTGTVTITGGTRSNLQGFSYSALASSPLVPGSQQTQSTAGDGV